jgi:hypothetical protein
MFILSPHFDSDTVPFNVIVYSGSWPNSICHQKSTSNKEVAIGKET